MVVVTSSEGSLIEYFSAVTCRPTVLDNFALLSGHISTLNRLLSSDKMPSFKNYAVIPLALSPGRDTELEVCCCWICLLECKIHLHHCLKPV